MSGIADKVVFITGGSRGIGRAIAFNFAKEGAKVFATSTTLEGAKELERRALEENLNINGLVLDVTSDSSVEECLQQLAGLGVKVEILINNAGIADASLLANMKDEQWHKVIDTNLSGAYRVTRLVVKDMIKARWGKIINISSLAGLTGWRGQSSYAASKAGLVGFTKSLAKELARKNINVNAVAPGFINTEMTKTLSKQMIGELVDNIPLGEMGDVQDIANAVLFLASDKASYITGEVLSVNGGIYI